MAQWKRMPSCQEMEETGVQFLGQENHLEKEIAAYSNILAQNNALDKGAGKATDHGMTKGQTRLSD